VTEVKNINQISADILILGSGGAGLLAALHAYDANTSLKIILAVKGLAGKSGCTRMVQGGYNVVLDPKDSHEKHFRDTIKGGGFINNQELAWTLVTDATRVIYELENKVGCFFDRRPDGRVHQKAFAGQSFDRTVHRGDLTGIEIIARLRDQVFARDIQVIEECRGLDLLTANGHVVGALMLDIRSGEPFIVNSKAVILGTGGGAAMYKISAPSKEKSGDGHAMAFRAGAEFVDMEMMQFHPTGLLAGDSQLSGSVLEEGLRGAGGRLFNSKGERFMERYDPERMERSTRDRVARASYREIMAGRGSENGGVFLDMSHLGAEFVEKTFPGMVDRVKDIGKDLAREPIEVSPTGHFHMGGVRIDNNCRCNLEGLFVAGEDAGGVHGSNRLGGNGVAESTVYGTRAGDAASAYVAGCDSLDVDAGQIDDLWHEAEGHFTGTVGEDAYRLRKELSDLTWEKIGVVRTKQDLEQAITQLSEMSYRAKKIKVGGPRRYNMEWNEALNVRNLITVASMIARSALVREESRGSHYRSDFTQTDNKNWLKNILLVKDGDEIRLHSEPVALKRLRPEDIA
jgi:succinate dehydrogenase / fumarate reductase flavoprotein subunit/fumarate reductase flavoprotein subunit